MALNDITVTVSAIPYVFKVNEVDASRVLRLDTTNGSLSLPFALTHSQQKGSATKPDRHLIRVDIAKQNPTSGLISTVSAHTVLTVPRAPAIAGTDLQLAYEILRTYLTPAQALAISKGLLP